ncbi:hypothetical protein BGZ63DRAFT_378374 [Mariannaea sp. PMI_226]|nr:hypothetical protein BGZ63DRAFT_378374 [Mariannaea sp. PMI_226]
MHLIHSSFCAQEDFPWHAESKKYTEAQLEEARRDILSHFEMPELLSTKTCVIHNGYFGCRPSYKNGKLIKYNTWFRILAKKIWKRHETSNNSKDYIWYEMGVYTRWRKGHHPTVLCVGMPPEMPQKLQAALGANPPIEGDPFALHIPLLEQIVKLQDDCVWRLRDPIREIEQQRKDKGVVVGFKEMHEISRHAIHISEVLEVTVNTFEGLLRQGKTVYGMKKRETPDDETYCEQALENLSFQAQMIKSLKLRNDSNNERLKSEIQVAYNTIAQQDNTVMKSIALLTMVFLPATFVSAFFSTTFFNFGDDGKWKVSKSIWIYVVVTIPVTVVSVRLWQLWLSGSLRHHLNNTDEDEKGPGGFWKWWEAIKEWFETLWTWLQNLFVTRKPKLSSPA